VFQWLLSLEEKSGLEDGGCPWRQMVVFRQGQLGDTVVAFPVIEALHNLWPQTPIVYCTNRFRRKRVVLGEDVCDLSPFITATATYYVEDSALRKWRQIAAATAKRGGSLLIYLPYAPATRWQIVRDWFFFRSMGFKDAIGFQAAWKWSGGWTKKSWLPKESTRLMDAVRSEGIPVRSVDSCAVRRDDQWAEDQWQRLGLNGRPVVAICPGTKMPSKRWPLDRYSEVGRRWHARTNAFLLVVGGPEDSEIGERLVNDWKGYAASFCGASLLQSAAILFRAAAYLGNDTGAMHLAAVQGVPCVALFSAREIPGLWHPFGSNHITLRHEMPCGGCRLEVCCYADPAPCLEKTDVDTVLAALEKVWQLPRTCAAGSPLVPLAPEHRSTQ